MTQTVATHPDAAPTAAVRGATERANTPWSHLTGLDGLRAIAVLAVLAYHAGLDVAQGGFLGVEVFFVISGFVIASSLLRQPRETRFRDFAQPFYVRRIFRIWPAALLWLLIPGALMVIVRRQWRTVVPRDRVLAIGLWAALLAFFVHGAVDYFMEFTPTYGLFWLIAGLLVGLLAGEQDVEFAGTADRV